AAQSATTKDAISQRTEAVRVIRCSPRIPPPPLPPLPPKGRGGAKTEERRHKRNPSLALRSLFHCVLLPPLPFVGEGAGGKGGFSNDHHQIIPMHHLFIGASPKNLRDLLRPHAAQLLHRPRWVVRQPARELHALGVAD